MPTSSTHSEQLATLGIHLPGWPEEPEGSGITGNWIQRGQAYAEGMGLWRAQLRRAAAFDGAGVMRLTAAVQNLGRQSAWDQGVVRYLLADLKAGGTDESVHAAAKLVAVNGRTPAQQLGAALALARDGLLVCALEAIQQLVETQQVSPAECLEICALLVANLPAAPEADGEGEPWLQNVALHLQASRVLASAASTASGEQNRAELVNQLEALALLAANGRPEPERDERAAISQVTTREHRQQTRPQGKPLLRTIHHLACTGGTVISKCLAAMPDVALISEVNPFNRSGSNFEPTNPLLLLERSYRPLSTDEILEDFSRQIQQAYQICERDDVDLVIRDHSHSDFCIGTEPSTTCPIADYLGGDYELLSAMTVRHPLDSYLGLLAQGWHKQFTPSSLDEYCRRYMAFLDRYASLPVLRYEDFCSQPAEFMKNLCDILQVGYSDSSLGRFGAVTLSGDSGRKGIKTIELRPRREVPEQVQVEIDSSGQYGELVGRMGY